VVCLEYFCAAVIRLLVVLQDLVIQYLCSFSHVTLLNICEKLLVYNETLCCELKCCFCVRVRVGFLCADTCYVKNLIAPVSTFSCPSEIKYQ
jgi:hypothetical protein